MSKTTGSIIWDSYLEEFNLSDDIIDRIILLRTNDMAELEVEKKHSHEWKEKFLKLKNEYKIMYA